MALVLPAGAANSCACRCSCASASTTPSFQPQLLRHAAALPPHPASASASPTRQVSHEIRSPASGIVGALDVLQTTPLTGQQRDLLEIISEGSASILSLVEEALNVGFKGTGGFVLRPLVCDVRADIVERSWNTIRLQSRFKEKIKGIRMELQTDSHVPAKGFADVGRVSQVIHNLVRPWPAQRAANTDCFPRVRRAEEALLGSAHPPPARADLTFSPRRAGCKLDPLRAPGDWFREARRRLLVGG